MTVQLEQRLISVAEYHKMIAAGILTEDDPIELLDGQMIYISPVGSKHSACVEKVVDYLKILLAKQAMIRAQNPVTLQDYSEPEPDISVVQVKKDFYASGHPIPSDVFFLIEVSDTTLEKDRKVKLSIYAKAGIAEYWIINLEEAQIEIYTQPYHNNYRLKQLFFKGDTIPLKQFQSSVEVDHLLI